MPEGVLKLLLQDPPPKPTRNTLQTKPFLSLFSQTLLIFRLLYSLFLIPRLSLEITDLNFKSWMHLGKRREKKTANTEGLAVWVVLKKKKYSGRV